MEKYIQCRKCLGKNVSIKSGKPIAEPGYIVEQVLGADGKTMVDSLIECDCHKSWRKRLAIISAAKRASLNLQWLDYDPNKDYVGDKSKESKDRLVNYVNKSLDKDVSDDIQTKLKSAVLYLYGTNGTQKTTLANWMGFEFIKHNKTVKYILMNDLIKLLQKADRDEDALEKIEKLESIDYLIIDEAFDKEKITIYKSNFQIPFADTFLRNRIQTKHMGIIFISNVSPYDIEEKGFNHSIQDLVVRNMKLCNGLLEFNDRYDDIMSTPDIENLF